jgi:hypothetical protein
MRGSKARPQRMPFFVHGAAAPSGSHASNFGGLTSLTEVIFLAGHDTVGGQRVVLGMAITLGGGESVG